MAKKKAKINSAMERIRKAAGLYVDYGYIWFSKPFKWNSAKFEIEIVEEKWRNWIRYFNLALVIFSTTGQTLSLAAEYLRGEMVFGKMSTLWRLVACGCCQLFTLLQIHTALRAYEIKDFTNQCLRYLKNLGRENILKNPQKFDKKFGYVLKMLFVFGYCVVLMECGAYIVQCNLHILSGILPICENGHFGWRTILYLFLLFYICTQHFCACLCYEAMTIVSDFGCAEVLERMRENPGPFKSTHSWIIHYKCLQLLFARMNDALAKYVFPTMLVIPIIIAVTVNYAFVVLDYGIILGTCGVLINGTIFTCMVVVIGQAAFFGNLSERLIREKHNLSSDNLWLRRVFRSLRKVQVEVGSFMVLRKSTVFQSLEFILNTTIDVVLIDDN